MAEEKWSRHVHIREGGLHGWCRKCPERERHMAIHRSVHEDGYARTVDRLDFLANVANRHDNERTHEVATEDLHWLEREHREGRA